MFKQTRLKIVITIMALLVCIFAGAITAICVVGYSAANKRSFEFLNDYTENYQLPSSDVTGDENSGDADGGSSEDPNETPAFRLSTFYSVAIDGNGNVLRIENSGELYSDSELYLKAKEILAEENHKAEGKDGGLVYVVSDKENYTLVAFKDITVFNDVIKIFVKIVVTFGCVTLLILCVVSFFIARSIVKPLEDSYKKQKQFVSDAGHELKTPLSAINVNADMLAREIGDNKWLSNIQYENGRMNELVQQLLILARTEKVSMPKEKLDFCRLTAGEVLPLESVAYEKNITIKTEMEESVFVYGNSAQLKQLVSILLDNAVQYSTGNEVSLAISKERRSVRLTVINEGKAMESGHKRNIFERFYRVDDSHDNSDGHYGLGLAIAKAIVTAHNGKIGVDCFDGKVRFTVTLPAAK
ncbi:MAG: HAMP domain-containing sensor histidine kinase [Clostridiales bacterium]|nr:HAMP domain-containing sensor histidine kinase [Clostridiales bacterium]